jgi:hypothetical protein
VSRYASNEVCITTAANGYDGINFPPTGSEIAFFWNYSALIVQKYSIFGYKVDQTPGYPSSKSETSNIKIAIRNGILVILTSDSSLQNQAKRTPQ